jgi:hypothetical protein
LKTANTARIVRAQCTQTTLPVQGAKAVSETTAPAMLVSRRKMNNINIVWTAVLSAVCGIGCIAAALAHNTDLVIALGLVSVSAALLAGREL